MRVPDVVTKVLATVIILASILLPVSLFSWNVYRGYQSYVVGKQFCIDQGYSANYCEYNWSHVQPRVNK